MPERIQRRRVAGWRMPDGAVYVGRPSKWGNPFSSKGFGCSPESAVELFKDMLNRAPVDAGGQDLFTKIRNSLAGEDLCCWCPPSSPCHADVLLSMANTPEVSA
jgi:hypothetical protein